MARRAAGLPNGSRITDYVSLGVVAKSFPAEKIRQVLCETGLLRAICGRVVSGQDISI